ncbi:hypothetical protein JHK85_040835 [Glycine max]|nr:hypothetical protein JHK87_040063 [Glycine soja]KAG4965860.1 hypothetical protein JHK85_040835 [Glycine max]
MLARRVEMLVRLEEPMPGWVTLNTDGSSCQGIAGCGGLICGPRGRWIRGFSKVGRANAFMAELCGLFEGLKLLQTQGYQAVNVQVNLEALVKSVVGNNDGCVEGWKSWKFIRCWVVHGGKQVHTPNSISKLHQLQRSSKSLKQGERLVGPTRRPDGTLRKPIRIRADYTP